MILFDVTCGKCGLEMVLDEDQTWSFVKHFSGRCVNSNQVEDDDPPPEMCRANCETSTIGANAGIGAGSQDASRMA